MIGTLAPERVRVEELDLGFIGTRSLSAFGANGFDALTAPMLVDSYPLQEAVLASGIPDRLLGMLDQAEVTGLAVSAGELRFPLGASGPLLSPEDFGGITFHTYRSTANAATVAALGATHTEVYGDERDQGLLDGTIDGTENGLQWMLSNGRAPFATVNVPLWPATGVLIANPDVVSELSDAEAQALRDAVSNSLATPAELAEADVALVPQVCSFGGRFAEASEDDVAALREAVEPVYIQLRSDADTAALIAEIEALKATVNAESHSVPAECIGSVATPATVELDAGDDPSVLNGSYQLEWTAEELMEESGGQITEELARGNAGVVVLTFDDGTFDQVLQTASDTVSCPGVYSVTEGRMTMVASSDIAEWECGGDSLGLLLADAAFEVTDDGLLLTDFVRSDTPDITWWNALYLGKPMTRIG